VVDINQAFMDLKNAGLELLQEAPVKLEF